MDKPEVRRLVVVDAVTVDVPEGATVIAAIAAAGILCTRRCVTQQQRFALCGIGHCQECRVTIDGVPQRLACRTRCEAGMHIVTGECS